MKIWILSVDDEHATWAKAFADKESAEEYFAETVADYWERYFPDDEMPEDAHKAWDKIVCESSCVDTISLEEDDFNLPPVCEAGPDLLAAIKVARHSIHTELKDKAVIAVVDAAIAKAEGK